MSNFTFLKEKWELLYSLGATAENYVYSDPGACMFKLGLFAEKMVEIIFTLDHIDLPKDDNTHANRIRLLKKEDLLPDEIDTLLHVIRKDRNDAVHNAADSPERAKILLEFAHTLACWYMETYGDWSFNATDFALPEDSSKQIDYKAMLQEKEKRIAELSAIAYSKPADAITVSLSDRVKKSREVASKKKLSEQETRYLIDFQLQSAGWLADTGNMRYSKGERPEKGKNKAIAEWPTNSKVTKGGFADYALFIGLKLVGIVEAKAIHIDIPSVIDNQCRDYAKNIKNEHRHYIMGEWDDYKVPFLFATNGRRYLKQLALKSGIWFLDARDKTNIPKALQGFVSPEGLQEWLDKDIEAANKQLNSLSYDLLTDKDGLNLRKYQIKAIQAVEQAVSDEKQTALLAMATGTGKTRTVLGLIYRFLYTKRFNRVLFLVDRTSLGEQAQEVFKDVKIEDLMSIDKIYNIKTLEDKEIEKETKIHIATVQSLVKRILYNESSTIPNVSDYDLIVIDEAHRGYTLDKELGEDELLYRNEKDFISKYRAVIDYFDAFKVAITATPALHTTEIFGKPVFNYSYREAVIDGYLMDHDAPHNISTKLSDEGIHYDIGEKVILYDPVTKEIMNSDELEDELDFDVEAFNDEIITESFNRTVFKEIADDIDPNGPGKTLIFAVNDLHADMIVQVLKEIYEPYGVDNEAIMKITGSIGFGNKEKVKKAIKLFKNERFPNIAVTVDLLTTGIDVPKITNLVFMRRVKSRILYEQMMGRATRPCDEIGKNHFEIYDPVRLYETLDPVNTMKPVVVDPKTSFTDLLDGFEVLDSEAKKKNQIDMIIAKLQRKQKSFDKKDIENFTDLTGGKDPKQFINEVLNMPVADAEELLLKNRRLFELLGGGKPNQGKTLIISDKEDHLTGHTRGYGDGEKPEDYLMEFKQFIDANMDKIAALKIICTNPKELTRESLKSLKLELDRAKFTEVQLNSAWRQWKNEEITADIISFIRQQALGTALVSHSERVKNAFNKLRKNHSFNKLQLGWLSKIEDYMMNESILDKETFDEGAFKSHGGFNRFNKIFHNNLEKILSDFNDYLYDYEGAQ